MPRRQDGSVISHWHVLFEEFSISSQTFYRAVETAIRERSLSDVEISRVRFRETHLGSAEREYLRVSRKRVAFDICSAPYGQGHFFSWWLAKIPPKHRVLGTIGIVLGLLLIQSVLVSLFGGGVLASIGFTFISTFLMLLVLGFFVEEGLIGDEEWVLSLPLFGYLYRLIFNPTAYYRLDTALMFRDAVRSAVNEVINDLREEKGLRALAPEELELRGNL